MISIFGPWRSARVRDLSLLVVCGSTFQKSEGIFLIGVDFLSRPISTLKPAFFDSFFVYHSKEIVGLSSNFKNTLPLTFLR